MGGCTVLSAANMDVMARAGALGMVWQQASMALSDMEHDGGGLEQAEMGFFIGGNLRKRMKG